MQTNREKLSQDTVCKLKDLRDFVNGCTCSNVNYLTISGVDVLIKQHEEVIIEERRKRIYGENSFFLK